MNKYVLLTLAVIFAVIHSQAMAPADKKDFTGEWKFNISHAPYGYQQGTIFIEEKKGELTGEIKFSDGEKVKMEKLSVTNGVLNFQLYVESGYVNGKATVEGNKFKGIALTSEGEIPFEAIKVVKTN